MTLQSATRIAKDRSDRPAEVLPLVQRWAWQETPITGAVIWITF